MVLDSDPISVDDDDNDDDYLTDVATSALLISLLKLDSDSPDTSTHRVSTPDTALRSNKSNRASRLRCTAARAAADNSTTDPRTPSRSRSRSRTRPRSCTSTHRASTPDADLRLNKSNRASRLRCAVARATADNSNANIRTPSRSRSRPRSCTSARRQSVPDTDSNHASRPHLLAARLNTHTPTHSHTRPAWK